MHARVAQYTFKPGQAREIAQRAELGMLPIFQARRGFRGYWVIVAENDVVFSVTIWDSEAQANEAVEASARWAEDNVADTIVNVENFVGELAFATLTRSTLD